MSDSEPEEPAQEQAIDIFSENPTRIFTPGTVISDDADFGTLISATVQQRYIPHIQHTKVTIRILPITGLHADTLHSVVTHFKSVLDTPLCVKYIGVWQLPSETWLVSERRRQVCLSNLFRHVSFSDPESIVAYIAQQALRALCCLHEEFGISHANVTPNTLHLCENGGISLGDVGIYHVLREALASRRAFPGAKIWPVFSSRDSNMIHRSDVWDVGITLLTLIDGGASVARQWRSGRRTPRLANAARWSAQLNSFLGYLFNGDDIPTCRELLEHRFVCGASATAAHAAMEEYMASREDVIADAYKHDMIGALYRQNNVVVRAPLISIDDVSTDYFEFEKWKGTDGNRPSVELSLVRMLKTCREKALTRDAEENKNLARTIDTLERFLDTADML